MIDVPKASFNEWNEFIMFHVLIPQGLLTLLAFYLVGILLEDIFV
jgi:hypothetical protein